jgi:ectoine hydroxylase-related dioxygenase (phytanoyl-CoA dioxygenase family)
MRPNPFTTSWRCKFCPNLGNGMIDFRMVQAVANRPLRAEPPALRGAAAVRKVRAMAFDIDEHARRIDEVGYSVIEDFLAAEDLAEVRRVLGFYLGTHRGRNDFEGEQTERVYTLVGRARVFWRVVLDPRVLALCERFLLPNFLLTASQAIQINPGETPQAFHSDDAFYHLPRPRQMVSLSTIVAVDAFTAENGGTEVIPGSHRWSDAELAGSYDAGGDRQPAFAEGEARRALRALPLVMPAGAAVVFAGTLLHRGGANRSARPRGAFSNQYCQPWARQQENFILAVPVEVARQMPARLQELLGYSVHPPFIGQLTASHPVKSLAPDYTNRLEAQARAAGARLPE